MTNHDSRVIDFYKPPNEVDLDSLTGRNSVLVRVLLGRLQDERRTVLPARVASQTRWYGFAQSDRDARLLLEELHAWLGPPITSRISVLWEAVDEVDAAARQLATGDTLIRAEVLEEWKKEARENVQSLVDLWSITPERSIDLPRPVGRVLRQFYEAISGRDRLSAEGALEEIRANALLSPSNRRFLRVELLGSLGSAVELRDDPTLRDITLIKRPPAVTDYLAEAADFLYISPHNDNGDKESWRDVALELENHWPGLISHPNQILSVAGARCLALTESLATQPRPLVCDALQSEWGDDTIVQAVIATLGLVTTHPHTPVTESITALDHYNRGEFESVLAATEAAEPDHKLAVAALHAALNLGDTSSAARAIALVDRLKPQQRETLLEQAVERTFLEQLIERNQGDRVPKNWQDWLVGDWPDRPDLLQEWSVEWDRGLLTSTNSTDVFASELLDALYDERRGRVRNGLPVFVLWLQGPAGLQPAAVPIAVMIFDIMLGSDPGRIERQAAIQLLREIFDAGCSATEYASTLDALKEQINRIGPRDAEWLTIVLDLLLLSSIPERAKRDELFYEALAVVRSWHERLEYADGLLFSSLFADVDLEYVPPILDGDDSHPRRVERTFDRVGIYSLAESAVQTATRWIADNWPGVGVDSSHAHMNSDQLQNLVRSSDVLLVQTSHAKHAATDAIRKAVDPSRLVLVNGRGASSLFRGLIDWSLGEG